MRIERPYLAWEPISKYYDMSSPTIHTLANNLMRNTVGHPATPATDFYPIGGEGVLAMGVGKVEGWKESIPNVATYELSRVPKYGAQGLLPPLNDPVRWKSLMGYYTHFAPCKIPPHIFRRLKRRLSDANLEPWTFEQVLAYQIAKGKLQSAGGVPYNAKRSKRYQDYINLARQGVLDPDAMVVGNRFQRQKLRTMFMASMVDTEREDRWIYPLQEWMRKEFGHVAALDGQEDVERRVTPWNSVGRTFISGDYSAMDMHCGPDQFHVYYDLIKWAFPRKYWAELKRDVMHAVNIPKIVSVGFMPGNTVQGKSKEYKLLVLHGTSANPSGDSWNQNIEDWLSISVWEEMLYDDFVDDYELVGDDSCGYSRKEWDPSVLAGKMSEISARRGLEMHPEKQEVSNHQFHYLQRYYEVDETFQQGVWRGAYPLVLALNSAKNPERDNITGSSRATEKRSIAWLTIVNNCRGHPKFHEIVDMFVEGDPNHLGLDSDLWYDDALYQEMRARGQLGGVGSFEKVPTRFEDLDVIKYLKTR